MDKLRPGRAARLWGSAGGLLALAVCFVLAIPARNQDNVAAEPLPPAVASERVKSDALAVFRSEREAARGVEIAQLNKVAGDESASREVRDEANRQLIALTRHMEQEVTLEGLLRAQGFEDVLCTVHADSVNVLVRADALTRAQSALILDMAMRQTGQAGGSVRVIPVAQSGVF